MVRSDVVAKVAIIPIEKQAVEPRVDRPATPGMEWFKDGRNGERRVCAAGIVVIDPIGLLPSRRLNWPTMNLNDVKVARVENPKEIKLAGVRT